MGRSPHDASVFRAFIVEEARCYGVLLPPKKAWNSEAGSFGRMPNSDSFLLGAILRYCQSLCMPWIFR
ncbi:hypothetical protein BH23PLA1_BH23PLA1_08670 [soil metagenome]